MEVRRWDSKEIINQAGGTPNCQIQSRLIKERICDVIVAANEIVKFVSAIFYQIFVFHQMIALLKL